MLLRGGQVYTARVRGSRAVDGILVPPDDGPWRLGISSAGTFENLRLEPVPNADAPLQPGQVRVALRAIAANFRDIMITLGMFTHDGLLGGEGAGVVVEVGPGVTEFAVGDSVYGFFPDGNGTLVAGDVRILQPMPADWSYAEAAAISAVFTTAYMAFVHLADVKPGQRVLVHAAAGGVGMAAVQLARHLGLEVFATASRGKWDTLRAMGFDDDHIARFTQSGVRGEVPRRSPAGRGMDVVLDSLAGEFVDASLRLVAPRRACSWRWARPTSATPRGRAGISGCALPRLRPVRARPSADAPVDARRSRGTVRSRCATAVAGHDVGCPACAGGVAVSEPGPPYRQGRDDAARRRRTRPARC